MGKANETLTIEGAAEIFRDSATPGRGIYAQAALSTVEPEELHAVRAMAMKLKDMTEAEMDRRNLPSPGKIQDTLEEVFGSRGEESG